MKTSFLALVAALLLALPLAGRADDPTPSARSDAAASARAAAAAAAEVERARGELRGAQRELDELSKRIAQLSMQIAREDIEAALARPAFDRPVYGLLLRTDPDGGVALAGVTPRSPADRAGLRGSDRITAINGTPIAAGTPQQRLDQALKLIGTPDDGQRLQLDYLRDGRTARLDLVAERLPGLGWWSDGDGNVDALLRRIQPMVADRLLPLESLSFMSLCQDEDCGFGALADLQRWRALRMAPVDAALGRYFGSERGVLVLSSDPQTFAELLGGDVLLAVGGIEVAQPRDVIRALREHAVGSQVEISLMRDRKRMGITVTTPELARYPGLAPRPPTPPAPPAAPAAPTPATPAAPPAPPSAPAPPAPTAPGMEGVLRQVLA